MRWRALRLRVVSESYHSREPQALRYDEQIRPASAGIERSMLDHGAGGSRTIGAGTDDEREPPQLFRHRPDDEATRTDCRSP